MFLYIARHAWAGESGDPRWPDDSLRELTPEGIERYDELVKTLVKRGFAPQRIATSPFARCRQTAELIAKRVPGNPTIEELEDLEPGSYLEPALEWTNAQGGARRLLGGPQPRLGTLHRDPHRRRVGPHPFRQGRRRRDRVR